MTTIWLIDSPLLLTWAVRSPCVAWPFMVPSTVSVTVASRDVSPLSGVSGMRSSADGCPGDAPCSGDAWLGEASC